MKTEITIEGIVYKVGDVLERYGHNDHEILFIGDNAFFTSMKSQTKAPDLNYIVCFSGLDNYKIKKPKKKVVVEFWVAITKWGTYTIWSTKENMASSMKETLAVEHVKFEYEIDE
jgi:hypothetical protein